MVSFLNPAEPKFQLGKLVSTPGALDAVPRAEMLLALRRHVSGDWGDLDDEDKTANEQALEHGGRLFSVYHSLAKDKFYVITEADRSVTTILLPHEY
jgi:hypothetical protein